MLADTERLLASLLSGTLLRCNDGLFNRPYRLLPSEIQRHRVLEEPGQCTTCSGKPQLNMLTPLPVRTVRSGCAFCINGLGFYRLTMRLWTFSGAFLFLWRNYSVQHFTFKSAKYMMSSEKRIVDVISKTGLIASLPRNPSLFPV